MGKLETIHGLLEDQEFDLAQQILERDLRGEEEFELLSRIYRHMQRYDREEKIIQGAPDNPYFADRRAWFQKPLFDRLIPRQGLAMPALPDHLPTAEVLEKLCIVTCASSNRLNWLIELLESIANTQRYKEVDVCIVDTGITDDDKDWLQRNHPNIRWIRTVPNTIPHTEEVKKLSPSLLSVHSYPFFDWIFPEYEYFLLLETDTWVQDERSLDDLLFHCQQHTFAKAHYNNGVMCYQKNHVLADEWRTQYIKNIFFNQQYNYYAQEKTLDFAFHQKGLKYFCPYDCSHPEGNPVWTNYNVDLFGIPVTESDSSMLRHAHFFTIIGIVHNSTMSTPDNLTILKRYNDQVFYVPSIFATGPLSEAAYHVHLHQYSRKILHTHPDEMDVPEEYSNWISLRYRVYPKEEIEL